jgi:hypothetical protein
MLRPRDPARSSHWTVEVNDPTLGSKPPQARGKIGVESDPRSHRGIMAPTTLL